MAGGSPPLNLVDLFRRRFYKHFAPDGATIHNAERGEISMKQSKRKIIRTFTTASLLICFSFSLFLQPYRIAGNFTVAAASCEPVRARHGIVSSTNEVASHVGVEVMKRGGNAVDAAIAVAFALAVTHPAAGNLGGGGFMMIRLKNGRTTAIDYREMAPAAATRNIYLDKNGNVIDGEGGSIEGYRAAGVPGTVRGMELALKKYGSHRLTRSQLIEPARRLGDNGCT